MLTPVKPAAANAVPGPSESDARLGARLLSNGRYRVLITPAGSGASWLLGRALTPFAGDPAEDRDGSFVYLEDLDRGARWSAAYEPTRSGEGPYEARSTPGRYVITRTCEEIETQLEICVPPDASAG